MVDEIVAYFRSEFMSVGDPEKAVQMKAYMKNKFEFFGVPAPIRKDIIKHGFQKFPIASEAELISLAYKLWQLPEREFQYVGVEFLFKYKKIISENAILELSYFIAAKSWWDTVDPISADNVGSFFTKYPTLQEKQVGIWLNSENMWLQRACIIHQLFYKQATDTAILTKAIVFCIDSKEFFIQKAIGWALRQYAKTDADFVKNFVNEYPLKPLSRREALKHFE